MTTVLDTGIVHAVVGMNAKHFMRMVFNMGKIKYVWDNDRTWTISLRNGEFAIQEIEKWRNKKDEIVVWYNSAMPYGYKDENGVFWCVGGRW